MGTVTCIEAAPETAPPGLTPEALQKGAIASKAVMAALGEITTVLMRSPELKHHSLADLEWLAVPAVTTGQFLLAEAQSKTSGLTAPVAMVLWASVSAEVDARLAANTGGPLRLTPGEWRSGDIPWVIEAVGEAPLVQALLKRLLATGAKDRPIKMRARGKDGKMRVAVLGDATQAGNGGSAATGAHNGATAQPKH